MHSSHDRTKTVLANTWQVERHLGTGGMATVYAAKHIRNGRQVAVKVLHAQASREPELVHRFVREGYLANAVNHAGVARIYDDGVTEDGCAFLIMDLLEGETLETARMARRRGRLPVTEALSIVRDVLGILAAAHDRKISHRDVKPDNVFLTTDGSVKLLDFGIATMAEHAASTSLSRASTGVGWGTPQFMAPEQVLGTTSCGPQVDVWAVAVLFFKLVTGKYPFNIGNLADLIEAHQTKPPMLNHLVHGVSESVAEVFDHAFTFHPAGRFADAGEMARALEEAERVVDGAPSSASAKGRCYFSTTLVLATVPRIPIETPSTVVAEDAVVTPAAATAALPSPSSSLLGTATTVWDSAIARPAPRRAALHRRSAARKIEPSSLPDHSIHSMHPMPPPSLMPSRPPSIVNQPRAVLGLLVVSIATFVSSAAYSFRVNALDPPAVTTTTTPHAAARHGGEHVAQNPMR